MHRVIAAAIIAIILLIGVNSSYCVEVSGEISGVWTADDSPYIVVDHIVVNEDDSLIVMPGTEVRFDGEYRIAVFGRLHITGTEEDSVLFTSNAEEPETGDWIHINQCRILLTNGKNYCILFLWENTMLDQSRQAPKKHLGIAL